MTQIHLEQHKISYALALALIEAVIVDENGTSVEINAEARTGQLKSEFSYQKNLIADAVVGILLGFDLAAVLEIMTKKEHIDADQLSNEKSKALLPVLTVAEVNSDQT